MSVNKELFIEDLKSKYTLLQEVNYLVKNVIKLIDEVNNVDEVKEEIETYVNELKQYVNQNGNTTEIAGNLLMTGDIIFDKNKTEGIRVASYTTSGKEQLNQVILTSDTTQTIVGNKQQDNVKLLGSEAPVWNDGTNEHTILTSKDASNIYNHKIRIQLIKGGLDYNFYFNCYSNYSEIVNTPELLYKNILEYKGVSSSPWTTCLIGSYAEDSTVGVVNPCFMTADTASYIIIKDLKNTELANITPQSTQTITDVVTKL